MDTKRRLGSLHSLDKAALLGQWRELFRRPAPDLRRDMLVRILAYRIQEQAYGGLSTRTRNRLRRLARLFEKDSKAALPSAPAIKPGTRLLRQWQGQTHTVTVIEGGFDYRGKGYASLSRIARLITGTRWSGPLFFGLKVNGKKDKKRVF